MTVHVDRNGSKQPAETPRILVLPLQQRNVLLASTPVSLLYTTIGGRPVHGPHTLADSGHWPQWPELKNSSICNSLCSKAQNAKA